MPSPSASRGVSSLVAVLALMSCSTGADSGQPLSQDPQGPRATSQAPRPVQPAETSLLFAVRGGDGDSWKDTAGREYRLGLVNAPELSECFGDAARDRRVALVRKGFRAKVYARDRFGRGVSSVTLRDGRNLNVELARTGYVDDRFLQQFRKENPGLARQLDVAFKAAKAERRGLWRACRSR